MVLVVLAGCSSVTVNGPARDASKPCTESYVAPIADTIIVLATATAFGVLAYSVADRPRHDDPQSHDDYDGLLIGVAALPTLGVVFGYSASASGGYADVRRCRGISRARS